MVRNKTELIHVANEWMNTAKADLATQTAAFMQRTGANVEQLANILDTSTTMVQAILDGTADIPMSLFAKILVGTGHVIVITPEHQMPAARGSKRSRVPQPTMPQMPPRDRNGRFVPRGQQMPPMGAMPMPMGRMQTPYGMPPMPQGGFPMPNPSGMMPSPEEVFANANGFEMPAAPAPCQPMVDVVEDTPMNNAPDPAVNGDDVTALAQALRQNPEVAALLRGLLGTEE